MYLLRGGDRFVNRIFLLSIWRELMRVGVVRLIDCGTGFFVLRVFWIFGVVFFIWV